MGGFKGRGSAGRGRGGPGDRSMAPPGLGVLRPAALGKGPKLRRRGAREGRPGALYRDPVAQQCGGHVWEAWGGAAVALVRVVTGLGASHVCLCGCGCDVRVFGFDFETGCFSLYLCPAVPWRFRQFEAVSPQKGVNAAAQRAGALNRTCKRVAARVKLPAGDTERID
jgi:hypothetical protein